MFMRQGVVVVVNTSHSTCGSAIGERLFPYKEKHFLSRNTQGALLVHVSLCRIRDGWGANFLEWFLFQQ